MFKQAAVVAAIAAAGLVSASPLAFAGAEDPGDGHHQHGNKTKQVNNQEGDHNTALVNVSGNNVDVPVQVCNNNVPVNVLGIQVPFFDNNPSLPLTGALAVLGVIDQDTENDFQVDNSRSCAQQSSAGDTQSNANN